MCKTVVKVLRTAHFIIQIVRAGTVHAPTIHAQATRAHHTCTYHTHTQIIKCPHAPYSRTNLKYSRTTHLIQAQTLLLVSLCACVRERLLEVACSCAFNYARVYISPVLTYMLKPIHILSYTPSQTATHSTGVLRDVESFMHICLLKEICGLY